MVIFHSYASLPEGTCLNSVIFVSRNDPQWHEFSSVANGGMAGLALLGEDPHMEDPKPMQIIYNTYIYVKYGLLSI